MWSGVVRKPSRMSESSWDALPEVREVVGRPSRRSWTCQETLLKVREGSGDFLGSPRVVGRPSQRSGSG